MDNPRSSSTVATICGWLSDEDLDLVGNLGLPDVYHWTNMMFWMQEMLWKYEAPYTDIGTLRLRFTRPHCVLCARSCPEARQGDEEDAHRPLAGPAGDEPANWSPPCNERIIYDCEHDVAWTFYPGLDETFKIPDSFFIPTDDGRMTDKCRACLIKELVIQWSEEAWEHSDKDSIWASCSGIHGIEDWHMTPIREDFDFGDEVVKNENTLLELFLTTPEPLRPSGTGSFPLTTRVHYWTRTALHDYNATLDVIPEDEEPDEESKEDKKKNDLARLEAFMPPHIPLW
ncbi:hypothetical protein FALBO_1186 [Fusarium albosuccineum]|uniref:Uncharacterized protein n=1 Tax=Fusarium albosuccineum TaxID=1237068 RepID=A0A8H4PIM3_9HYPO|nr:hypothetical protein FALBO_1186 [Fusarium albosuccineum]